MKIVKIKTGEYGERPLSKVRLFVEEMGGSDRSHRIYREEILPKVFKKLKIEPYNGIRWSWKAGCSCGCSPGFILDIVPYCVGYEAIWVTIK